MWPKKKNSNKDQKDFYEIYTSSESWINKLSIDVWFVRNLDEILLFENLESNGAKKKIKILTKSPLKLSKLSP